MPLLSLCMGLSNGCFSGYVNMKKAPSRIPEEQAKPVQRTSGQVRLHLLQLSGEKLCTQEMYKDDTVQDLKFKVQLETQIPWVRQRLLKKDADAPLQDSDLLGDLVSGSAESVELLLIQVQPPEELQQVPENASLLKAIKESDSQKCLQLLTLKKLPGLNDADPTYCTVLHHAAWNGLADVCQAILDRPDFTEADALDATGLSALHCAAHRGHLGVVHTLLMSQAFTAIDSRNATFDRGGCGWSARDVAQTCGRDAIMLAIDAAVRK